MERYNVKSAAQLRKLAGKTGSRSWLNEDFLAGKKNFTIDEFEQIISAAFEGRRFETLWIGANTSEYPREDQQLHEMLQAAIEQAKAVGVIDMVRFTIRGMLKTVLEEAAAAQQKPTEQHTARQKSARASPRPQIREGAGKDSHAAGSREDRHRKSGT